MPIGIPAAALRFSIRRKLEDFPRSIDIRAVAAAAPSVRAEPQAAALHRNLAAIGELPDCIGFEAALGRRAEGDHSHVIAFTELMSDYQPAALGGRGLVLLALPFRSFERESIGQPGQRLVAQRRPILEAMLVDEGREHGQQKILQIQPFLARAALTREFCVAMTGGAGALNGFVWNLLFHILAIQRVSDLFHFRSRQPVRLAEILFDLARVGTGNIETMQPHHALDGFLPTLGRLSHIGNPAHALLGIHVVTGPTRIANQFAFHRQTFTREAIRQETGGSRRKNESRSGQ